jgi:hypothetical protein
VVDRAHGDPVRHDRLTAVGVLLDVRRVKELAVAEAAQGALGPVGREHLAAEDRLVQAPADDPLGVFAPADQVGRGQVHLGPPLVAELLERQDELLLLGLLVDEPHGRLDQVDAGADASEPRERLAELHGSAERDVVGVVRVGAAPLVPRIAVLADVVLIRPVLRAGSVCGQDGEGGLEVPDLPNPGLADQGDPAAVELGALEVVPGGHAGADGELGEEGEGGGSEPVVVVGRADHGGSIARSS